MFTVFILVNGRVVASKEFFGSPDLIAPSAWQAMIAAGVESETKKLEAPNAEQLAFELSEKE